MIDDYSASLQAADVEMLPRLTAYQAAPRKPRMFGYCRAFGEVDCTDPTLSTHL
jgi:hypothetical protein